MHTHTHICMCMCTHVHTCLHKHTHICIYVCVSRHVCTFPPPPIPLTFSYLAVVHLQVLLLQWEKVFFFWLCGPQIGQYCSSFVTSNQLFCAVKKVSLQRLWTIQCVQVSSVFSVSYNIEQTSWFLFCEFISKTNLCVSNPVRCIFSMSSWVTSYLICADRHWSVSVMYYKYSKWSQNFVEQSHDFVSITLCSLKRQSITNIMPLSNSGSAVFIFLLSLC